MITVGQLSMIYSLKEVTCKRDTMKKVIFFLFVLLISSCSRDNSPEGVLSGYINKRFKAGVAADDFQSFFGGELLEEMSQLSEDQINRVNNIKGSKSSFKIDYKRCNGTEECFLTYTLKYDTKAKADKASSDVRVKVKKIAQMRTVDGNWRIFDISDVKSHYDYKELNK
jgi:hypothetical protein